MKVLIYNEIDPKSIPGFAKMRAYLEADDFKSAEVKKIGDNLYRARLNQRDRLLFSIYRYQTECFALILESIKNHAYEDSRFLRGVSTLDESRIPEITTAPSEKENTLVYLNPLKHRFNLLDKIISFDDCQQAIYDLPPPLIVIGSAGSGKTALTLEKMKQAIGHVLYVTQSAYLVKSARDLYYAHGYDNPDQQVDFLSFQEFLESIQVPLGKPVAFSSFQQWFNRHRQGHGLKDAHKVFEEIRGVLTGPATDKGWLTREDYLDLGVKESIFLTEEREAVYSVFEKYLSFLSESSLYDPNILSYEYLQLIEPSYDFVVVDEVQDLTNIQLYLILRSLQNNSDFLLCGDSNQIVHPNFFSWGKVKSLFYRQDDLNAGDEMIRVLNTNYRNSPQVTEIANRILKIKNLRFGSIDRESHYLVESNGHNQGEVLFLKDGPEVRLELDRKTKASTRFAVIVMNADQKPAAQLHFGTPLIFTIQEAKGLEYENIILYNFLSEEESRYREICSGVDSADLVHDLKYARGKDKTDKSLEVFKFYINALYVALTRAIKNLYWIESQPKQAFLELLSLGEAKASLEIASQDSSLDAWRLEAHKLELQGKQEQADRIRNEILKQKTPPWQVMDESTLPTLMHRGLEGNDKAARMALFEYALVYEDMGILNELLKLGFKAAKHPEKGLLMLQQNHYSAYDFRKPDAVMRLVNDYGPDFRNVFNQTPLMVAAWMGNVDVIKALFEQGADTEKVDSNGLTALQIALVRSDQSEAYAKKKLSEIYPELEPTSMSVQVDGRLIKLDKHTMEFFLLNLMIALFYRVMPRRLSFIVGGFNTNALIEAIEYIPSFILPERRKKRAYLSGVLARNEISREAKNNRKLFYRIARGSYVFNPTLAIKLEGEWINIFELLKIDRLSKKHFTEGDWVMDYNEHFDRVLEANKATLKHLIAEMQAGGDSRLTSSPA